MSHSITTTLSEPSYAFLDRYARSIKKPRNYILEQWLKLLERQVLEQAVREWFSNDRSEEYTSINAEFHEAQTTSVSI